MGNICIGITTTSKSGGKCRSVFCNGFVIRSGNYYSRGHTDAFSASHQHVHQSLTAEELEGEHLCEFAAVVQLQHTLRILTYLPAL